jgi:uncharacterized protein
LTFRFKARGHPAVRSTHRTTLEITRDQDLTKRGDCIVAVGSTKGLPEFPEDLKEILTQSGATGHLILSTGHFTFKVEGSGDPGLTFSHATDIVVRKSKFISDRTLLINADKSAVDLPRGMVRLLQDPRRSVTIEISATTP